MKRHLIVFFATLLSAAGWAQPTLEFTVVNLTGPGLVQPVDITGCGDNSGRLFITEKRGTIRIIENGAVLPDFFLNIQSQVMNSGERGLLGLAFHPQYPDSPYIYVNYVIAGTITNRISRFSLNPNNAYDIDESTELELLTQMGVQANHKAGDLAFGPDGFLYIGMGDGGGGFDPEDTGQDTSTLLGKMLRIDINSKTPPLNYSIPSTNPYVGGPGRDEIWAIGLRNPWRISFDRENGDFWIADVGQNAWEEVNWLPNGTPPGSNFGWDCYEGNGHAIEPQNCPGGTIFTWPLFEYPHNCNPCPNGYGASLSGGFVYRGAMFPALYGYYVFADYVSNYVWALRPAASNPPYEVVVQNGAGMVSGIVTFGEGDDGEMYASNLAGTLYSVGASGTLPIQWEKLLATRGPKNNRIEWTIHQTFGIDYFEIQRAEKAPFDPYTEVARIDPVSGQNHYIHDDPLNGSGSVYYRVAAMMDDGSTEYSPIARIGPEASSKPTLVYDLQTQAWRIALPEPWQNGHLIVYDMLGREIQSRSILADAHIDLTAPVVPGSYFVKVSGEMGIWSEQLVR